MKLKVFNKETVGAVTTLPRLVISETGRISLNKGLASLLDIKDKDKVEFLQSEDSPKDWYIRKTSSESGFLIRNKGEKEYLVQNAVFAKTFLKFFALTGSFKFKISENAVDFDGTKLLLIITASAQAAVSNRSKSKEVTTC